MRHHASKAPVLIVGAGIAGLTAAHCLRQQGIPTIILESASRVGGRMTTDTFNGHAVDCGAQFLSSEYTFILDMLRSLGLTPQLVETSQRSAIVRAGTPRPLRINHPLDAFNLFGFNPTLKLAWNALTLGRHQRALSLSDYSQWAKFDTEDVATWANRALDQSITEYLYEPMLHGFYFQTPEETSKALAMALSSFAFRRAKTLTLRSGLGVLPETLALGLDVRLNTPARAIEYRNGKVVVHTPTEAFTAARVIVAVPAPVAQRLIAQTSEEDMQALLATPYSASINVACITDAHFRLQDNLKNVYGLLIPRNERTVVAAVGIENNKNRSGDVTGHLLNIMLSHPAALQLMPGSDSAIIEVATRAVYSYFPDLSEYITQSRVYRWPTAEPLSFVGRSAKLHAYRQRCAKCPPVLLLAGDYMSMPYTEGAAESGYWAAQKVVQDLR